MSEFYTATDHYVVVPAIMLALFGCAVLLFDFWMFPQARHRKYLLLVLIGGEIFTGVHLWRQGNFLSAQGLSELVAFRGSLVLDGFSLFFNWIFVAATIIVAIASYRYLEIEGEHHGEYYGLILVAQSGMFFLAAGTDLITLFIGVELMALCFYVMVGFLRGQKRSNEAAIKYLLLGAFSSGLMVYGFSLLYGLSGSTKLSVIGQAVAAREPWDPMLFLAIATISVGLLFKVSAAPFHMWAPDAYEGAPTTVTAYLAVGSKAASFAFLMRMYLGPLSEGRPTWEPLLIGAAVLSMTIGNIAAVTQSNVKRLLAYSSISHAGYILLGLVAGNQTGIKGMAVYILVYAFMTMGAFIVVVALRRKELIGEDIDDMAGLIHKSPGYAVLMLIFLLSLAGIPPTAGFIGKYYIFLALLETGHYVLAAVAALYVAVAIYYYFRIVRSMFVSEAAETPPLATTVGVRVALAVTGVLTLVMGVYPEPFLRLAQSSLTR
ncbi:MAG: NADH-quinone oxidoreductase subunit N [Bryobacteraceae bacterium]|nr:NADH-quinone oxidoreductase subunit N [Bryobacteraceae bacterium]